MSRPLPCVLPQLVARFPRDRHRFDCALRAGSPHPRFAPPSPAGRGLFVGATSVRDWRDGAGPERRSRTGETEPDWRDGAGPESRGQISTLLSRAGSRPMRLSRRVTCMFPKGVDQVTVRTDVEKHNEVRWDVSADGNDGPGRLPAREQEHHERAQDASPTLSQSSCRHLTISNSAAGEHVS
jgi:hypothetical protein